MQRRRADLPRLQLHRPASTASTTTSAASAKSTASPATTRSTPAAAPTSSSATRRTTRSSSAGAPTGSTGGTGSDAILGDDGRIFESRNEATGVKWTPAGSGHGSWGTPCSGNGTFSCLAEPLNGIQALLATDPDTKFSNGNVLNEFIYTPGQVQTSTINVKDVLSIRVRHHAVQRDAERELGADQPLFDANNSDDVIFGGWDNDFLHGGSGDDAISGAEAGVNTYVQHFNFTSCAQTQTNYCADGVVETDWAHPWNPGNILQFGADTDAWHSNGHTAPRLGEFLLYDEYDPRREILFDGTGATWGCVATIHGGHDCSGDNGPITSFPYSYFLNNNANDGRAHPGVHRGRPAGQLHRVLAGSDEAERPERVPQLQRRRRRGLRRPRQRLAGRRHRPGHAVGRLGQRPPERRRRR